MSDFFNRKGLLPSTVRVTSAAKARPNQPSSADEATEDVFSRSTIVPELPADAHAKALMDALGDEPTPKAPKGGTWGASAPELELELDPSPLELVERQTLPGDEPPTTAQRELPSLRPTPQANVEDLYDLGDFTGALAAAVARLKDDPHDPVALAYRARAEEQLIGMWSAKLGALDTPVQVLLSSEELKWLALDHRAGFLLSLIDGKATVEQILDMAGMPRVEALRILCELEGRSVIDVAG